MSRPDTVTGLNTAGDIASITLSWRPLPWSTTVDHYRVYGVPGSNGGPLRDPREQDLVAKTVYPRLIHGGLAAKGETWTYAVITVDASGRRSRPSRSVTGESTVSITHSGQPLAEVGDFDGRTLEFQYAPDDYPSIPTTYPDAVIEVDHGPNAATRWPYLLPGPGDAWAGDQAYRLDWTLTLSEPPQQPAMAIWLVDTTRLGGTLEVAVNGTTVAERTLIAGGTRGSTEGDAGEPGTALVPSYHEFDLPPDAFADGSNTISFTLADGGWAAWDGVGLYDR